MTHENYKELLAAQALTALDAEDARALDTHLESCADCRLEISGFEDAAALLAFDAEPLEPSAGVRGGILASVRAEARAGSLFDGRVASPDSQNQGKVVAFERPHRIVWSIQRGNAIAAIAAFVAIFIGMVYLARGIFMASVEIARLEEELHQTKAQLARDRAMGELLTSPDAHMAKLTGTNVAPGAHAMLAYDKTGHAMLMAKGLPKAPEGMAYQLWYIKDNNKMPGRVFTPDAAGNGTLEDQIPAGAREAAVFAITLEPKAGVQVPTGSIYLLSSS